MIDGPSFRLTLAAAMTVAPAFHELATTAAAYGALSVQEGCVEVRWRRFEREAGAAAVGIERREHGGPIATAPV
jgi:two-component sensor histidine kinase